MPLPARLEQVQKLMAAGDERARRIYETIGVFFGYNIATYADFYDFRNCWCWPRHDRRGRRPDPLRRRPRPPGGVPGSGRARPFHIPGEQEKRHGQAIAAASLPTIPNRRPTIPNQEKPHAIS